MLNCYGVIHSVTIRLNFMKITISIFLFVVLWQLNVFAQNNNYKVSSAVYQFFHSTKLTTKFKSVGLESRDTTLFSAVAGLMKLSLLEVSDSGALFYCSFIRFENVVSPLPTVTTEALKLDMKNGCQFFQNNNGLVKSVHFAIKPSEAGEAFWSQFLQYFQCSRTPGKLQIETPDAILDANFAKGDNLQEIKLVQLEMGEETAIPQTIGKYYLFEPSIHYLFDHDVPSLLSVKGNITKLTRLNHSTIMIQHDSIFIKKISDKEDVNEKAGNKKIVYSRTLFFPEKSELRKRERLIKKSNELSVQSILQQLRQNEIKKDDILKDDLVEGIRICFETGKDSLYLIRDEFLKTPENSYQFKTMRAALVGAGSDTAQLYLINYINSYKNNCNRIRKLISATGLIQKPTLQIQQLLEMIAFDNNIAEDCSNAAQLALGNLSGNLQYSDRTRSDSLALMLCRKLYHNADTLQTLSVLGNTNSNVILPFIYPYLTANESAYRGYAFYALRFVSNDTANVIFKNVLEKETDSTIISNVLQALYYQKFNLNYFQFINRIINSYPSQKIRLQALQLVEQWSYRRLFLEESIRKYAATNSMPAVASQAKTIVQQFER